ncbi:MAG: D-alanyl-D-alanine carboxypeptidase/D-alanyl-D-alanine-endopeptidase [Bacteroidales bacterium]|nr:D-alanyl-D-alanine carboxypeptidase/D-alanyl-D-alanine-endopeptidase [Bacteroidales bacterium]
MRYIITYFLLFIGCFTSIAQSSLDDSLVGYSVIDIKNHSIIAEKNGDMALIPASVTKVITTATVLEIIPSSKKFETKIEYNGKVTNGTLYGKLIIKGCGDPTLGSQYIESSKERVFENIATMLKRNGINNVCGEVVCDNSLFPYNGARGAWLCEDLGNYYAAESYGVNFIDNQYSLYFNTGNEGGNATITKCEPLMPELKFINRLKVKGNGKDSAYITGMDFCDIRLLNGTIPCNKSNYKLKGAIPSPSAVFERELRNFLITNGMWVESSNDIAINKTNNTLGVIYSPQLKDIVTITNHRSNNLYAETLLKWCGLVRGGEATSDKGIGVVMNLWQERGVDMSNCLLFDGSGLSPKNKISSNCIANILCKAYENVAFKNSLPKVGIDGTVKNFMKDMPSAKHLSLKTGSMQGVQCYAGYYDNGSDIYAIVIMVNNFNGKRKDVQIEIGRLIENIITNN